MKSVSEITICDHCGLECTEDIIQSQEGIFCCQGCASIASLLKGQGFSTDYPTDLWGPEKDELAYLNDPEVAERLFEFHDGEIARIHFKLPEIHCSSCIRLLENLYEYNQGISHSRVNFLKKEASITFRPEQISLRQLVELLEAIGYPPLLKFEELEKDRGKENSKRIFYQLGLAGFCFGNIMLFSFPEYLGVEDQEIVSIFRMLNIILILPVLLYSAADYWRSAFQSLRMLRLNIDVPIVLGMATLLGRSLYEIFSGYGEGYLDSLAGFTFFLLIGRWFQDKTFEAISFDRNYKSYFPMAVMKKCDGKWQSVPLNKIGKGDHLLIRSGELIPVDGRLVKGEAVIDYSFVTGESRPVSRQEGERLFAGGAQKAAAIEIRAATEIKQTYLTKLWDERPFHQERKSSTDVFLDRLSKYFTLSIMFIALTSGLVWWQWDPSNTFLVTTSVLIVACPCAIALAIPFVYGSVLRFLGLKGFFLRNVGVIRLMQQVDTIVFDKTGTLTDPENYTVAYKGKDLNEDETKMLAALCMQSVHPKAVAILKSLKDHDHYPEVKNFKEITGAGMQAIVEGKQIRLGSAAFVHETSVKAEPGVFLEIEGQQLGKFTFRDMLREGVGDMIRELNGHYQLALLSGDTEEARAEMQKLFPPCSDLCFEMQPKQKLDYIASLQLQGSKVMFIGDGLNDAGALKQSDIGIVIAGDKNHFTPSSDAILPASQWPYFLKYLTYIKRSRLLLKGAFLFALLYNIIGLAFAVQGLLSPIVAAILMPVSSISIMIYGLISVRWSGRAIKKVQGINALSS